MREGLARRLPRVRVGRAGRLRPRPRPAARRLLRDLLERRASASRLQVAVLGGDRRLRISNLSGKNVVIFGRDGEPFLRFTSEAVFSREGDGWEQVATGTTYDWAEPRIGWNESSPPQGVAADPGRTQFIRDWSIAGRAGGREFAIKGFLGWAPHAGGGSGTGGDAADGRAFFIAFGLTAVGILAAALLYVSRRRTSSSSRSA